MESPRSPHESEIRVRCGEPVRIAMEGGGATGYSWDVETDRTRVRLTDRSTQPDLSSFGASGRQVFVLTPIKGGETEVTFKLTAPWEPHPAEVRVVRIQCYDE